MRAASGFRFECLGPQGFTDRLGLTGGLLDESWLIEGLEGRPAGTVRLSVFLSSRDGLPVLPLLTRRTMSLEEEEIRGVFGSAGLLLREETLAGGRLYWRSASSAPCRSSLRSL